MPALPATTAAIRAAYLASAGVTGIAPVTAVADQSGNANDIATVSGVSLVTVNGRPTFRHDGSGFMTLPASLASDARANSVFFVHRALTRGSMGMIWSPADGDLASIYGALSTYVLHDGAAKQPNIYLSDERRLAGIVCSATDSKMIVGPESQTLTVCGAQSGTGGAIGKYVAGGSLLYTGDWEACLVYPSAISAADIAIVQAWSVANFGAGGTASPRFFVFRGDSLTFGFGLAAPTTDNDYPTRFARKFVSEPKFVNNGNSGDTLAQMQSDYSTKVGVWNTQAANIAERWAVIWGGTNDIAGGADAATVLDRLWGASGVVTLAKADGFRVAVLNVIARGTFSGGQETIRQAVNAGIAANWATHADAMVDVAGFFTNSADATYYQADGIHLTAAGAQKVADLAFAQIVPASPSGGAFGSAQRFRFTPSKIRRAAVNRLN